MHKNPHLAACIVLRRPLVGIALAVVTGMAIAATGLFSFDVLLFAALCCILIAGLFFRTRASGMLVFCCVVLVSACRFVVAAAPLSEVEINRLQPQLPLKNVQIAGRVLDPPEYHAYRSGKLGVWVIPLECEGLQCGGAILECAGSTALLKATSREASLSMRNTTGSNGMCNNTPTPSTSNRRGAPSPSTINQPCGEWKKYRGRIQVRVTGAQPGESFQQGERIRFSGMLRQRAFPGGDPVELVSPASNAWETLSGPPRFSPVIWGQRLRAAAAQTLSNGIENHPDQLAVLKALLLGYRKAIPPEIHQQFKRTGTLHIFAISGLHVGIAGLLITVVLKTMGIPRDRWGLWLLPLLLAYVMATGMKSSALRALTMAAVYFLSPIFRRKPDVPVSIAFAAILLLFFKPLEILSAGFIFSFTVVSFIVMVFAVVPTGFIFRGEGWVRMVRVYIASLGITSVAAFIASVPLTALFFGSFTTLSLLANLIVVPLTFCVVLSGWLSIILPVASEIFNHAALVFINGLLGTVAALARLPGAHGTVPPPPLTALLFWYCGWIYLFVHARSARQRTTSFILVFLSIALTVLTSL